MVRSRPLASMAILIAIVFAICAATRAQSQSAPGPVGTYQVSTSYRDAGNWVFVTVIDTRSGEVVRRERYSGFAKYSETK
jgi:hypothetical protein